jgi:predicted kinase
MKLIVVAGLPCSGKSKLVEVLRAELPWPILVKDEYKEIIFDTLGYSNRPWSKKVSQSAYQLMFKTVDELSRCGYPFVIEGNFRFSEHRQQFEKIAAKGYELLQIYCSASVPILTERFKQRALSGLRHSGHVDVESLDEINHELSSATLEPMPLPGRIIHCNTSDHWQQVIANAAHTAIEWSRVSS